MTKEDEGKLDLIDSKKQDRGFKTFCLSDSNFKAWDADAAEKVPQLEKQLELHVSHLRENRIEIDFLYEILLKDGYPLTVSVKHELIGSKGLYSVSEGALIICLDRALTLEFIKGVADKKPERVVCLDEGFAGNDQLKTNAVQTFKARNIVFRTV